MKKVFGSWLISLGILFAAGCGRVTDPKPPEVLSPSAVGDLVVTPLVTGVQFEWRAPDTTQESKHLKQIDGYRIYRKQIARASDFYNSHIVSDEIAFIPDEHLAHLKQLKDEAREKGDLSRRIKIPDSEKKFRWTDETAVLGTTYAYLVVPVNQGGTDGAANQFIRVIFRGMNSEIESLPYVKTAFSF